jgi:hypothetical protein
MKVGDLVKLVPVGRWQVVTVAWGNPDDERESFLDVPNETRFDGGKVVVLLELRSYDGFSSRVAWVLVDGRRGWAWEHELGEL